MDTGKPPPESVIGLLILAAVLVIFSMIFSASESAFLSINKLRIRFLRNKQDKKAITVGKLLDSKEKLLNTVLVANNIVNIAVSSILTALAMQFFGARGVGIATITATIILLIFGEITPKTLGASHPETIAFFFAPLIKAALVLLSPLVTLLTFFSQSFSRAFGIKSDNKNVSFTEEEIKNLIDVGEEEGILDSGEKKMLHRAFKFTDLSASEIMVPRIEIRAIHLAATYWDVLELSQKSHFSRFPVYERDLDDIKGIVYIKDVLFYTGDKHNFSLKTIMRPPVFILENRRISSIQQTLREKKQSIAIVIDEYSGTAGLLTTENMAEEIFGSITDEYDIAEKPTVITLNENESIIDGSTRLIDISEHLGISLVSHFYDTIAGYIAEKIDDMPVTGTSIAESGWQFTVIETKKHRITKVKLSRETT